jgi:DNA-directed RNA polymerase specialized sigma24 family protein
VSFSVLPELGYSIPPEDEKSSQREKQGALANEALNRLTNAQWRRFLLRHVYGLSAYKIADIEGRNHKSIYESLQAADKKIKNIWEQLKNTPQKAPSKVHYMGGILSDAPIEKRD